MNYQWSLDALYKGYQDPQYQKDFSLYIKLSTQFSQYIKTMNDNESSIKEGLKLLEKEYDYSYRLKMYSLLIQTMDSTNKEAIRELQKISDLQSSYSSFIIKIENHLGSLNIQSADPFLLEYQYYLKGLKDKQKHTLNSLQEDILSALYPSTLKSMSDMYYHLTSCAHLECLGQDMTLTQIKNLCHDPSQNIRKEAFLKEMECYQQIAEPLSFAMNNIKKQQLYISRLRGYQDPLDKMLKESGMKKETLDAMISSVEDYLPIFQEYLYNKAKKLGHENGMPWYDIYATIDECQYHFTIDECEDIILHCFKDIDNSLYQMTKRAFDEKWIDYPSRKGKQGGAFCENLAWIQESRLMTNYNSTLSDVVTVAHELGHAYHGHMIEHHRPLNREYCMPLAETASMFNENIIYHSFYQKADQKNQMLILDIQLSALCQVVCDIYARYTFEKSVFENIEKNFLFAEDLNKLMIDALKKAFGKGMDAKWLHPYRWITKVHYYIPDIAYYNFPYTFGALFARGLYAIYQNDHTFFKDYQELLKASTTHTVEETAMIAGIDLTKKDFWIQSLESIYQQMLQFMK
ncbi:M3 family oligoendopeptidase [Candidatus Stoquefichus massiliensis]|uniref:M3 family oligoendopeptidase n=1 Tax=Candidatus Stoquefichus massiliensis TaxID=1470350 RepID=UPI0004827514|nr:M3 family oligoendopeptidase [Candidatus Stoquefichus massiliensis]